MKVSGTFINPNARGGSDPVPARSYSSREMPARPDTEARPASAALARAPSASATRTRVPGARRTSRSKCSTPRRLDRRVHLAIDSAEVRDPHVEIHVLASTQSSPDR